MTSGPLDAAEAAWQRLWQLLWDCCDTPRPLPLRRVVTDDGHTYTTKIVVVMCENCGARH